MAQTCKPKGCDPLGQPGSLLSKNSIPSPSYYLFDATKDRSEEVRVVVTHFSLKNCRQSFQAHPRVDMTFGQFHDFASWKPAVLNKDNVPEFR